MKGFFRVKKAIGIGIVAAFLAVLLFFAALLPVLVGSQGKGGNIDIEDLPEIITQEMVIGAMESEKKYGVPASLTLAQIILESSGNYPGGLSKLAFECHNLFGMKGIGPAGYKEYQTGEQTSNGESYVIYAKFRKYHNVKESIDDHGKLLSSATYKKYTQNCKTADEWAKAIHKAGYATAVDYSQKLIELMGMYDLYSFDNGGRIDGSGIAKGKMVWVTVGNCTITSYFGDREAPTAGASTSHMAIDIAAYSGAPIYAADGGKVIYAGNSGGGGNTIRIDHGNGIQTTYMHLQNGGILVKIGQKVSRGQKIGRMGSTGISTGPHLHFAVTINGEPKDPLKYVKKP
ncbi:peptidoglycan DD-metalloendopeptidase family protein [Emergencia sp. 1XD21-10]|uniref:peptidoglycan DD-metalloendopeptidase family protein n=1 Tax=Emergencia sp. 1XD21-10 TaxID=2304569 RepID=UPI00137B5FD6|nr:peptidoglycan DD-metalloendopeptidase family protein [Emergencia sp. 1XD21-10]